VKGGKVETQTWELLKRTKKTAEKASKSGGSKVKSHTFPGVKRKGAVSQEKGRKGKRLGSTGGVKIPKGGGQISYQLEKEKQEKKGFQKGSRKGGGTVRF